uniref:NACHT domain-containing protein n=1 Tax=Strigamia maritima TaxID=126957 RepID=T1IS78_STRMM
MEEIDLPISIQQILENNSFNGGIVQIGNKNSVTICTAAEEAENCNDCLVKKLEFALKEIYKQLTLPKLSWLDEGLDLALDTFYMELQLDKDKRLIKLEELFHSSSNCNRLLIESKPGYGKTTLCIKLLHDWANDAPYTEQFEMTFLIPLKNLPDDGIEDALAAIIPDCGIDKEDLMDIIMKRGKRVLIVLDGFDEINKSQRQNVLRVMYRQRFYDATVIITSRCGEFYVRAEDLEKIFGTAAFKREFSNVKYTITGISECEVSRFVNNISPHCDVERLNSIANINPELFQCPLFIVLFAFLSSCSENIEELDTQTKLYCSLFNCIIKNSLTKDKKSFTKNFDIFDVSDKSSDCEKKILYEFGKMIKGWAMMKLQFDICPLTEKVYKLGFLVKHQKMSLFKTTSHFEAFHRSILDFIVAYAIWLDCSNLLDYLKKFISLYSNVEECIWDLISRNKLTAGLLRQFCNYMPFHSYASSFSFEELKMGVVSGRIKKVCILDDDDDFGVLPDVLIPQLRLIVTNGNQIPHDELFSYLEKVKCINFILDFQFGTIDFHVFQIYLQSFKVINSKRNTIINLNSQTINKLPANFDSGGIKIDHVECKLFGKNIKEFDCLRRFTTALKVESLVKCELLENTFTSRHKLVDIFSLLPTSAEAVVVVKNGERDRKEWYENVSKGMITSHSGYKKITYLNVNTPDRDILWSVLKVTTVSILRCLSNHFLNAFNTLPSCWPGFNHFEELSLILCMGLSPNIWEIISKFRNLKCLELQMLGILKPSDHIDSLVKCILSLSVTNLSFHVEIKDDIEFPKCLIQKLKEVCCAKTSYTLNTLSVISVHNCEHTLVSDLLECVKLKLFLKVQFIINPDVWTDIVRKTNIDYSIFNVNFDNIIDNKSYTVRIVYHRSNTKDFKVGSVNTCIRRKEMDPKTIMEEIDLTASIQRNSPSGGILQIGNENSVTVCTAVEAVENCRDYLSMYSTFIIIKKLEFALKEIYKQLTLPKLSWLDEGLDLALDTFYMELQLDKDKRLIKLEELFDSSSNCNRLLIESKPGYGKTTLCIKLLHDWANDAPYTEQFEMTFLIPLKNLPDDGIEDALAAIIPDCGIDKEDLMDIIMKRGKRVLIVLDGFDEINKSQRQNVLRVMYRQRFYDATVIITSRCGEFYVRAEDLEKIFGTAAFKREFSNVKYTITGIIINLKIENRAIKKTGIMAINIKTEPNFLQDNSFNRGIIKIGYVDSITVMPCAVGNDSNESEAKNLEFALKEIYKQLSLPKLSWMDGGIDFTLDKFYMELELDDRVKQLIMLEDIFKYDCNRILIEGKPGFGKTTLCIKLLYDWANDEPYTAQFKLAFLIPLKNLPKDGIEEGLAAILPDWRIDNLTRIIKEAGKNVLIVLDGFDELSNGMKQNVLRVVYRQIYYEATVVLTCRSGEFIVQDLEEIFSTPAFKREYPGVKYIITGIKENEIVKFMNRASLYCDILRLEKVAQSNPELQLIICTEEHNEVPNQITMDVIIISMTTCISELEKEFSETNSSRYGYEDTALFRIPTKETRLSNVSSETKHDSTEFSLFDDSSPEESNTVDNNLTSVEYPVSSNDTENDLNMWLNNDVTFNGSDESGGAYYWDVNPSLSSDRAFNMENFSRSFELDSEQEKISFYYGPEITIDTSMFTHTMKETTTGKTSQMYTHPITQLSALLTLKKIFMSSPLSWGFGNSDAIVTPTSVNPQSVVTKSASEGSQCRHRTLSFCDDVSSYNSTYLPNLAGATTEFEKWQLVSYYNSIVDWECNLWLKEYLCYILEPMCVDEVAVPPCNSLCKAAKKGCEKFITGSPTLEAVFRCDVFPSATAQILCAGLGNGEACKHNEYRCSDTTCIPGTWWCDGVMDCEQGDDEKDCHPRNRNP